MRIVECLSSILSRRDPNVHKNKGAQRCVRRLTAVSIVIEECKIESNIDRASPGVGRIKRINFLLNSSRFDSLLHQVKRAFIYFLHLSF